MVHTLLFDLDDTLLWDKKSISESLLATCNDASRKAGVDSSELMEAVKAVAPSLYEEQSFYPLTTMLGINPFEGLWGTFDDIHDVRFREMGANIRVYQFDVWMEALRKVGNEDLSLARELSRRFIEYRETLPYVYEETFEVLTRMSKSYQLALVTNGAPSLQIKKLEMTKALIPHFDRVVISGSFGIGKPDPSIFLHALAQFEAKKDQAVMIGDNLHTDILGANRAGIKSVWLNRDQEQNDSAIIPNAEINHLRELGNTLDSLNGQSQ
ncbi:putative hydrolase of the HAD superfamily [Geomicrobium halophilum]|uniref:Phosphoserine phosphatase n=1 Tax=Geomicrobium halophilum TaxID=549000 RepID=A0A841PJR8_9BACL|nr:HAD family hydrolase [Geomicrobium halophilum]MBB6449117.1 putative hydrolase of the HAD superfamily [Geomicrobium halophilum]